MRDIDDGFEKNENNGEAENSRDCDFEDMTGRLTEDTVAASGEESGSSEALFSSEYSSVDSGAADGTKSESSETVNSMKAGASSASETVNGSDWQQRQQTFGEEARTAAGTAYGQPDSFEGVKASEYQDMREKAEKKDAKKAGKNGKKTNKNSAGKVILKAAAFVLCAVLLGVISAGTFIGVIHATGYDDKLEAAINAADRVSEAHINSVSVNGTVASNPEAGGADVAAIFENTISSVVSITSKVIYESQGYGFFFNGGTYESTGAGSGIIISENDSELLIVTNYHVVEDASSLVISFVDGKEASATVKGTSEEDDLAVVAVKLSDIEEDTLNSISMAVVGDSDSLKVGDQVIAIGNALGYGQSLTVGYVSALSRDVTINGVTRTLLQTDAAINPGNSGGALLNDKGELIGINSAKYSDTDVEGIGFAIPISSVKELIEELINKEPLVEVDESQASFLGITPANVDSTSAYMYNMPVGVYIYGLTAGGPAEKSGLQVRDIIIKINGTTVKSDDELKSELKYYAGGTTVDITVERIVDGVYQEITVPVELGLKSDYEKNSASAIN